ncbi:MAG: prepilin peptidase [Deltaproteobacteria bacterium]|jgi:leader peptidase (prepilin peptidase)/N-methyltransferase
MELEEALAKSGLPVGAIVLVFGLLVGSFLNVVIARLPYGESVVHPRSRCPKCETLIAAWWNIPVISWIVLRGKCATCKAPIDARYPAVELLTGVLFLACYQRYGLSLALLTSLLLTGNLVAITFIDIDLFEIPDEIVLPGIFFGMILRPLAFDVPYYSGLLGAVVGGASLLSIRFFYYLIRGREGLGLGDPKLFAMIGAFSGVTALIPVLLIASISGSVVGIVVHLFDRGPENEEEAKREEEALPPEEIPPDGFFARFGWSLRMTFFPPPLPFEGFEDEDSEEPGWDPPRGAIPFGPFLALGAFANLLFGPTFQRILFGVGLI